MQVLLRDDSHLGLESSSVALHLLACRATQDPSGKSATATNPAPSLDRSLRVALLVRGMRPLSSPEMVRTHPT
jgi:hypothetical protein